VIVARLVAVLVTTDRACMALALIVVVMSPRTV